MNSRSSEVLPNDIALIEWRSKAKIISMVDEDDDSRNLMKFDGAGRDRAASSVAYSLSQQLKLVAGRDQATETTYREDARPVKITPVDASREILGLKRTTVDAFMG